MRRKALRWMIAPTALFFCAALNGQQPDSSAPQQTKPAPTAQGQQTAPPSESSSTPANGGQAVSPDMTEKNLYAACWELLATGIASDKTRDRSDALSALTILNKNHRAIKMIEGALNDKEESVRTMAAISLGDIHSRASVVPLRKALLDDSPQMSFAAARALWKMGDRSGREIFYAVLAGERTNNPGFVKSNLSRAKQEMHDPKALALIGINESAGALLGPFSMGISLIEAYAKDLAAPVQALCAQLLASDNTADTADQLKTALDDKNWTVRVAAARALAEMNRREAVPQLREIFDHDKQLAAQFVAAAAILRLMGHRGRPIAKDGAAKSTKSRSEGRMLAPRRS